jgi:hypothetical protein
MQRIVENPGGFRQVHTYEPMTREKRPQDPQRNGAELRLLPLERDGFDGCPEALDVYDAEGRHCIYLVQEGFSADYNRAELATPADIARVETLEHGGEYGDDMPQLVRLWDEAGRAASYRPITVDGKAVDSKGFCIESPDSSFKCLEEAADH